MDRRRFLNIIRSLESSDNTNTEHPSVQSGMHKGDKAVGQYALMPNTVDYILDAEKRDTGEDSPYEHLRGLSSDELKDSFNKDKLIPEPIRRSQEGSEDYLAGRYADQILNKYKDPTLAQAAWNQGHNSDPEDLKQINEENPVMQDRAQKTQKLMDDADREELIGRAPSSLQKKSKVPNILDLLKLRGE